MVSTRSGKPYGQGRIRFLAQLAGIRDELKAGQTMTTVHAKRAKKLGITYSAFTQLVARYASDARPSFALKSATEDKLPATKDTTTRHERQARQDHSGTVDPALLRKLTHGK